jgi:Vacuolar sorting protein 9 (VPS9) domain
VVGVQVEHLGVDLSGREKEFLRPAVEAIGVEFRSLDGVYCPREKLEILVKVHKILVDGLTFPGENDASTKPSSADLLLPVLIYRFPFTVNNANCSIIQTKAETLISNIQFIQRFRADSLLQGEASYCLTNLVPPSPNTTPHPVGSSHRLSRNSRPENTQPPDPHHRNPTHPRTTTLHPLHKTSCTNPTTRLGRPP